MEHVTAKDDIAERSNFEVIRKKEQWRRRKELEEMEQEEHHFVYIKIKCKRMAGALILSGGSIMVAASNMRIRSNLQTTGL